MFTYILTLAILGVIGSALKDCEVFMLSKRYNNNNYLDLLTNSNSQVESVPEYNNTDEFHSILKYFIKIYQNGEIDKETFETIVKHLSAVFIENEISERIDRILEGKIFRNYLMELI